MTQGAALPVAGRPVPDGPSHSSSSSVGPPSALIDHHSTGMSNGHEDTTQIRSTSASMTTYAPGGTGLGGETSRWPEVTVVFVKKLIGWG